MTAVRLGRDRTEADAREDEDVVGLRRWRASARRPRRPANGEPVATIARPASVQRRMSAGTASAFAVGLDSASTIGRSAAGRDRPQDRFVERAADAGRADHDGRSDALDGLDRGWVLGREAVGGEVGGRQRLARAWSRRGPRAGRGRARASRPGTSAAPRGRLRHPRLEHRQAEQPGDPDPRRTCPDEHDPRVGEGRSPSAAQPGQHARRRRPRPSPGCRR